ncbi:DUF3331 domain-containing protein [Paraburkholderia humisilvae]|uniref:DUF3331 domain-containing protein n=1 Tax=Paraburkholderia humisilvae TaxID=627669 RepID=A0A6J5ETG8_9BURK|nr:DUF3331 domain-containing protein [Paraburkholderia humisilvae]CAB3768907.1 hypothetical protein LMG29542_05972 [Paraburkholderia humisilvae]
MNGIDRWSHIVKGLRGRAPEIAHAIRRAAYASCDFDERPPFSMANVSTIRRIERQTESTLLVSWSDPTLGRYQDQTWRAGFARRPGVCGLTGMPVCRGDAVYKPVVRGGAKPLNAFDMILASALPLACMRLSGDPLVQLML